MSSTIDYFSILWSILVCLYFMCALLFFLFRQKTEKEENQRRRMMFLVSFLFLFLGLSRLFDLLSYLNNMDTTLWAINQLFLISALIVIIFSFEKRITSSSKYILTVALFATEVLYLVFRQLRLMNETDQALNTLSSTFQLILAITMVVAGLSILILYLKIFAQATGQIKTKSLFIIIGILFLILSFGIYLFESLGVNRDLVLLGSFGCSIISIPFLVLGYK